LLPSITGISRLSGHTHNGHVGALGKSTATQITRSGALLTGGQQIIITAH
jgi:hypothetical protein